MKNIKVKNRGNKVLITINKESALLDRNQVEALLCDIEDAMKKEIAIFAFAKDDIISSCEDMDIEVTDELCADALALLRKKADFSSGLDWGLVLECICIADSKMNGGKQ
jgi:hypothetical protein